MTIICPHSKHVLELNKQQEDLLDLVSEETPVISFYVACPHCSHTWVRGGSYGDDVVNIFGGDIDKYANITNPDCDRLLITNPNYDLVDGLLKPKATRPLG